MTAFLERQIGHTVQVLVEQDRRARTPHFAEVYLDRDLPAGTLVDVVVTSRTEAGLDGRVLDATAPSEPTVKAKQPEPKA